ncbi:MAG TPA: hypothetical protein VNM22_08850 [Candidatus Limnocylindrales bacterium]|nr:hypothetical protein [Candidatus Limnocylindrales bacterium]
MRKQLRLKPLFLTSGLFIFLMVYADKASAQPSAGSYELRFNLSARSGLGNNPSSVRASGHAGYFLTESSEIGFSASVANREEANIRGSALGFYSYHFRHLFEDPRLLPFVSVGIGAGFDSQTVFAENNEIGIKYFFGKHIGLTTSLTYQVRSKIDNDLLFEFGLLAVTK